jgi:dephospho-CoA kinase
VIDDEIVARGEAPDRATRQRAGMEIHHAKGQRWLCERVLERVSNQKLIVIDGLRFPEDHAFFVERFGSAFFHIHITAPDGLRAARYRESERDGLSFEIADRQPVEEKVEELAKFAATVLPNDASTDELANNVMKSVREFAHKQGDECLSQL